MTRNCASTAQVRDIKRKTVAARMPVNDVAADITRLLVTGCLVTPDDAGDR